MTGPASKLAKRLAENPAWEWLDGALGLRWAPKYADHLAVGYRVNASMRGRGFTEDLVPDLDDWPTIGTIEGQTRAKCPGLIMFPPDSPGEDYAISKGPIAGDGSCLCYAPTLGECWAQAFLEVHK